MGTIARPTPTRPRSELGVIRHQEEAAARIAADIDSATSSVNAEFFALFPDGPGKLVTDALGRAARRGVDVQLMVDGLGNVLVGFGTGSPASWLRSMKTMRELEQSGVRITRAWRLSSKPAQRHVDHRKVVAVDGRVGYVGGMNFGKSTAGWHDAMVRMTGGAAVALASEQTLRLQRMHSRKKIHAPVRTLQQARDGVVLLANAPDEQRFEITHWYRDRIANAKHRIWVTSPALFDNETIVALKAAVKRGVDVRVVIPGEGLKGIPLVYPMQRAQASHVSDAGVAVKELRGYSHMKSMVVDDWATIGSFNLTDRSAEHDHELNVASADPAFVRQVEALFTDLERQSVVPAPNRTATSVGRLFDAYGIEY